MSSFSGYETSSGLLPITQSKYIKHFYKGAYAPTHYHQGKVSINLQTHLGGTCIRKRLFLHHSINKHNWLMFNQILDENHDTNIHSDNDDGKRQRMSTYSGDQLYTNVSVEINVCFLYPFILCNR